MFDTVRKHRKILQIVLLVLIVPSFALFGISSYSSFMDKETDIAKVNGKPITAQEVENAAKRQADRVGGNLQITQSLPFRQAVLNELLKQRILDFAVTNLRLQVGKQELINSLQKIPQIRALYRPDDSFDNERFKQLLASNGLNEDQFYSGQIYDLKIGQLVNSTARSGLAEPKLAGLISAAYETERQVQTLEFNSKNYISQVKPTPEELQSYYEANARLFESPEYVDIEYIVLKAGSNEDAKLFGDKADQFANMTYDQSDSLKPAADKLKLAIQTQKGITRVGAPGLNKENPLSNPKVIQGLFGDDSLKNKRNTEAVQTTPGVYVSARVIQYYPAQILPFNEVAPEIKRQVSLLAAEKLAVAAAATKLAELEKDPNNVTGFARPFWVSRNKPANLVGSALDGVMGVNLEKLPMVISIANSGVGTTIYRVDQVRQPVDADPKIRQAQAQQIQALTAQSEFSGLMGYWRNKAEVKMINPLKAPSSNASGS